MGREGIENSSTMASTNEALNMTSTPNIEMINTFLARSQEKVICIQMLVIEYEHRKVSLFMYTLFPHF